MNARLRITTVKWSRCSDLTCNQSNLLGVPEDALASTYVSQKAVAVTCSQVASQKGGYPLRRSLVGRDKAVLINTRSASPGCAYVAE